MLQCGDERLHCGYVRFVFVHLIQNKQRSFTSRLPLKLCLRRAPCCKKKHQESNKYCRSLLHGSVQMTSFSLEFKYLQSTRSLPAPSDSSTASLKGVSEGLRVVAENQKICGWCDPAGLLLTNCIITSCWIEASSAPLHKPRPVKAEMMYLMLNFLNQSSSYTLILTHAGM